MTEHATENTAENRTENLVEVSARLIAESNSTKIDLPAIELEILKSEITALHTTILNQKVNLKHYATMLMHKNNLVNTLTKVVEVGENTCSDYLTQVENAKKDFAEQRIKTLAALKDRNDERATNNRKMTWLYTIMSATSGDRFRIDYNDETVSVPILQLKNYIQGKNHKINYKEFVASGSLETRIDKTLDFLENYLVE